MERGPNGEDGITKVEKFPWKTTKKLKSSKEVNGSGKRSHKEIVWQKEVKSTRFERRQQCMARS